jgi:hypothetical protein
MPTDADTLLRPRTWVARLAVVGVATLLFAGLDSTPSEARDCSTIKVTAWTGDTVKAAIKRLDASCRRARRVVRDFYDEPLSSAGGTLAAGYRCQYIDYGRRVTCSSRNGAGSQRLKWRERAPWTPPA